MVGSRSAVFYVCAALERRGYIALMTLRNSEAVDIIASHEISLKSVSIQVKSSESPDIPHFLLGNKFSKLTDLQLENIAYVFVEIDPLRKNDMPHIYILPGIVVKKKSNHKNWSYIRKIDVHEFENDWDVIHKMAGFPIKDSPKGMEKWFISNQARKR